MSDQPNASGLSLVKIVLPDTVPDSVSSEFGRQCQYLDDGLLGLSSSLERRALIKFLRTHLDAQLTLIELAG
jgi:hypothetical protein